MNNIAHFYQLNRENKIVMFKKFSAVHVYLFWFGKFCFKQKVECFWKNIPLP